MPQELYHILAFAVCGGLVLLAFCLLKSEGCHCGKRLSAWQKHVSGCPQCKAEKRAENERDQTSEK